MRGKKSKLLRKIVYGEMSQREERRYGLINEVKKFFRRKGKKYEVVTGTFISTGLRRDYRIIKKMARDNRWTINDIKQELESSKDL